MELYNIKEQVSFLETQYKILTKSIYKERTEDEISKINEFLLNTFDFNLSFLESIRSLTNNQIYILNEIKNKQES